MIGAGFWTKLRRCDWQERAALAEALALLIVASALLRLLPFRLVGRLASATAAAAPDEARRTFDVSLVGWAVDRAAKRSPLRAMCIERGLAASWMLRRRGIDATLFYGVAPRRDGRTGIEAHVWVQDRGIDVTGTPEPGRYAVLASFPAGRIGPAGASAA